MIWILIALVLLFLLALALIVFAVLFWKVAKGIKRDNNIQDGEISYSDLDRPARALFSKRHLIAGKPDYIVRNSDGIIPVEVKGCSANAPYENHVLQVAAYCLLVAEAFGIEPDYGVLVYGNRQFRIGYDYALKEQLQAAVGEMRRCLNAGIAGRNHEEIGKCVNCGFKEMCRENMCKGNVK